LATVKRDGRNNPDRDLASPGPRAESPLLPAAGSRPTLKQVAAVAGVSWKTVSRVVNDEAGVAPATRTLVRRVADELGYRPDTVASSLRRLDQRSATVGVLLDRLSNPFAGSVLRAVEDACRDRGVSVFAASLDEDPDRERARVADLLARRVDGLILAPVRRHAPHLESLAARGYPLVLIDRELETVIADHVLVDNERGARLATEHLLAHGHRRIAFLGDRSHISTAQGRLAGYRAAMAAAGLAADERAATLDVDSAGAAEHALADFFRSDRPPTAVFAGQNEITVGVLRHLQHMAGGRDVGLVGFDDFPLADMLGVTVVVQDVEEIGRTAATLLFDRIDGDRSPARRHELPVHLVDRGSAAGVHGLPPVRGTAPH
jgi:LacI family transcriptional regulator